MWWLQQEVEWGGVGGIAAQAGLMMVWCGVCGVCVLSCAGLYLCTASAV